MKWWDYPEALRSILSSLLLEDIDKVVEVLRTARAEGRQIFIMGNGGSGSTASHIAGDLLKACGMRATCLNDNVPLLTALANDDGWDKVFSRQIGRLVNDRDVVIVLSGTGRSANIVGALAACKGRKGIAIALLGQVLAEDGGYAAGVADITVVVPSDNMEQIEDVHLMIGHMIKAALQESSIDSA